MRQFGLPRTFSSNSFHCAHVTLLAGRPARDGRYDADCVSVLGARIFLFEEADVLVVQIDVHEAANFSLVREEVLSQLGKTRCQAAERLSHGGRVTFDAGLLSSELAKRRGN